MTRTFKAFVVAGIVALGASLPAQTAVVVIAQRA